MSKLVHVNKLEMTEIENLTPLRVVSDTSVKFTNEVPFSPVDILELVGVNIEDSYENNQKVYTTTAVFNTFCKKPMANRRLAFRLTSVDGKRYLIGLNTRPFPIIKEKNPYPEKPTDTSLKNVTITWKSFYPMMLIED